MRETATLPCLGVKVQFFTSECQDITDCCLTSLLVKVSCSSRGLLHNVNLGWVMLLDELPGFHHTTSVTAGDCSGQWTCSKFPTRDCSTEALLEASATLENSQKLQWPLCPEVFSCILKFEYGFTNVTLIGVFAALTWSCTCTCLFYKAWGTHLCELELSIAWGWGRSLPWSGRKV